MKAKIVKNAALFFAAVSMGAFSSAETLILEAEDFQFKSDWYRENTSGQNVLMTTTSKANPTTVFSVNDGGEYDVWMSAYDYPEFRPASRLLTMSVNGEPLPGVAGKHGFDGFRWEKMGRAKLDKGENMLTISLKTDHARCDAILFSNEQGFDPNKSADTLRKRIQFKKSPVYKTPVYEDTLPAVPEYDASAGGRSIGVKNGKIALVYTERKDEKGNKFYVRSAGVFKDGKLVMLPEYKDEGLYLIYSSEVKHDGQDYYARWFGAGERGMRLDVNGKKLLVDTPPTNPYCVGEGELLLLKDVKSIDKDTLELTYSGGVKATAKILPEGLIKFDVSFTADKDGSYSFAMLGFNKKSRKDGFKSLFLPTFYQGSSIMLEPRMLEDRMTSHPLAMVETDEGGLNITSALVADPKMLPFEWSRKDSSRYGFSISSPDGQVQTAIFHGVLGNKHAQFKEGDKVVGSWYIITLNGDWRDAFELVDKKIFAADNIREAFTCSFSDAADNIANYLKDGKHSGWSSIDKGRWNIEAQYMGTQSSPLSELSIAILTDDEDFYKNIALPSMEFTLSRRTAHFAYKKPVRGSWAHDSMCTLSVPSGGSTSDVYAGEFFLLGGGNTWLRDLYYHNKGNVKTMNNPAWTSLLGIYLADPNPELLERVKRECDHWLSYAFDTKPHGEPDPVPFVNDGFYPYWWYLPDLYEITKDKKYLEAAEKGAFRSMICLWAWPTPPEGDVVINKGNIKQGIQHPFWAGGEKFRLGGEGNVAALNMLQKAGMKLFEKDQLFVMPEKKVPAKLVSRIGLGIEQHWTYKWTGNYHNILNPSWAAEMLKTYQYSGRDILMKFSRHAIIGRYANFPGYYIKDFTDVQHDADYPYKGPDSTSLYYHHSTVHFGQTFDYLMAQIEVASGNKIKFPYVRQQGYVWFTDRIFGAPGRVFDDTLCRPILDKNAVRPDSVKVSTLLARGKNAIWVIALNDSASDGSFSFKFDSSARGMRGAKVDEPVSLFDGSGKDTGKTFGFFSDKKVDIPAMGIVAFRIPAEDFNPEIKVRPIEGPGHLSKMNVGGDWKDAHVFRIRSPFGKDSVYAVFTGALFKENAKVTMTLNTSKGTRKFTRDFYPFEFSVYPIGMDDDCEVSFLLEEKGKEPIELKFDKLGK